MGFFYLLFAPATLQNQPFTIHGKWYNGKKGDSGAVLESCHSREDDIPHAYIQQIGTGQDSAYYHIQR